MKIKLQIFFQLAHGYLLILGLVALLAAVVFPNETLLYFSHGLLILIPYAVTFWGVRCLKHFTSYFLTGLVSCAAMYLLGLHFYESLYLTALAVLILLGRIPSRIKNERGLLDTPLVGLLGYFVLLFFLALLLKSRPLQELVYGLTFAYLAVLLLYSNISHLNSYLYSRRDTANLPGVQILSTNRVMVGIFSGLALIAMLLVPLLPADRLLSGIGQLIISFLRWLSGFLPEKEQAVIETVAETMPAGENIMDSLPPAKPTPLWLQLLSDILCYAAFILTTAGLLAAALFGIYRLIRHFYRPAGNTGDVAEFIDGENTSQFVGLDRMKKREHSLGFLLRPDAFIRRQYRKTIRNGAASRPKDNRGPVPKTLTPAELEDYAGLSPDEKNRLLHELYEKARYSKDGCTKKDAADLKKAIK